MTDLATVSPEILNGADQARLLPDDPPQRAFQLLSLSLLPPDDAPAFAGRKLGGDDSPFVSNVRSLGVLEPILVVAQGGTYRIEDGRKRVLAARLCEFEDVPAIVIHGSVWDAPGVIGLSANEHRSDNLHSDLQAVEQLLESGYSIEEICGALRIRRQRVDYLLKFQKLIPELRQAMGDGRLPRSVAEACARLSVSDQEEIAARLALGERIRAADVRELRSAVRTEALTGLDLGVDVAAPLPSARELIRTRGGWIGPVLSAIESGSVYRDAPEEALRVHGALLTITEELAVTSPHEGVTPALQHMRASIEAFKDGGDVSDLRIACYAGLAATALLMYG